MGREPHSEAPSLNARILRLGLPSMAAALSVPLIGIVDTALVGHLPEVAYLGAVAVASVIFDVLYWGFGFLRMGTTALVAQYYGAGQRRSCTEVLYQAGAIAVTAGLAFVLLRHFIAEAGFYLAGGTDEVQLWGKQYFAIRIYGAPLVLTGFVLVGFFRGAANAMAPMWMTIVVNVVNVVGDYVLIYGKLGAPEMGVLGAAWASVLGGMAGLIYALGVLVLRYRHYLAERPTSLLSGPKLRLLLATNINLFGRTASLLFAQFFMLSTVARMGEVALAANALMMQIWSLASYTVDGFAFAAETLVGNCLGAKAFAEARRVARRCILWGLALGVGYAIGYAAAIDPIVAGFTDHDPVRWTAASLIFWVAAIQPLNAVVFILDGIFIGANDTAYLFGAMALAAFGIYLPATLFLVYGLGLGLKGAWMGYNCLMIGRLATLLPRYAGTRWMRTFVDDGIA